jgi:hypothetical protein
MAEAISTVTSIPSQHWRDVLDIDYDRVHRVRPLVLLVFLMSQNMIRVGSDLAA